MRIFKITPKIEIVANFEKQRDGFRHRATLVLNGKEVDETTVHYINRTWESYEFQSVMEKLVDKTSYLTAEEKAMAHKWLQGDRTDWSGFKAIGMVARMGDIIAKTPKEKNVWKTRMLKAGLGNQGLEIPEDWESLPEKTKTARLNKVIDLVSDIGNKQKKKTKSKLNVPKETKVWN